MTMERRNPLPVGRYWVDIIDTKSYPGASLHFTAWLVRNKGKVEVVKREEIDSVSTWDPVFHPDDGYQYAPKRLWYLFDVKLPALWEKGKGWGFPSVVKSATAPKAPDIKTASDTAKRPPDPPGLLEQLDQSFSTVKTVAIIAALVWAFTKVGGKD